MTYSTADLKFTDNNNGKVVGYHDFTSVAYKPGEGLSNKEAKEIIIPNLYLGKKIIEIGNSAFRETNIESVFIPKFVKNIQQGAFFDCKKLKYVTFDTNCELETMNAHIFGSNIIESINFPPFLKSFTSISGIFANIFSLKCVSYLGSNDLGYSYLFNNIFSSFSVHSLPNYQYKIGTIDPIKDGQKCPEKTYEFQIKRMSRGCTCKRKQFNNIPLISFIIDLVIS